MVRTTANDNLVGISVHVHGQIARQKIETSVKIGIEVILIPEVKIEENALVTAGKVLTMDVPVGQAINGFGA